VALSLLALQDLSIVFVRFKVLAGRSPGFAWVLSLVTAIVLSGESSDSELAQVQATFTSAYMLSFMLACELLDSILQLQYLLFPGGM
jgi:hypothetical protein